MFVDNADTTRGAALHTRVDKGSGALPLTLSRKANPTSESAGADEDSRISKTDGESERIHSRSVTLGSDRLGVIAKLDLVEVRASNAEPDLLSTLEVCPVDYKVGAPREGEDGNQLWPTDQMQLGLQILILRDNGYRCDRGIIYYRATKQRVPLDWTLRLKTGCWRRLSPRQTMAGPIPPPMVWFAEVHPVFA